MAGSVARVSDAPDSGVNFVRLPLLGPQLKHRRIGVRSGRGAEEVSRIFTVGKAQHNLAGADLFTPTGTPFKSCQDIGAEFLELLSVLSQLAGLNELAEFGLN